MNAMQRIVVTTDATATRALATSLAAVARAGDVIALHGDLGAGKTQFAKGFAVGLGIADTVNSPSFVLMSEYAGRLPLFHRNRSRTFLRWLLRQARSHRHRSPQALRRTRSAHARKRRDQGQRPPR